MSAAFPSKLTGIQQKGNACAHCGREYVLSDGPYAVPLRRDGVFVTGPAGWQLYVCANTREKDVSVPAWYAGPLDEYDPDPEVDDPDDGEKGTHSACTPCVIQAVADDGHSLDEAYWQGYRDGRKKERRKQRRRDRDRARRDEQLHDWLDELLIDQRNLMRHFGLLSVLDPKIERDSAALRAGGR